MTTVVNIKKGQRCDVYIGRPGKGKDGYFGNPHVVGFCKICNRVHERGEAVQMFKPYFENRIKTDTKFKRRVDELKNKVLGCFCKPNVCHGDVYKEYLDGPPPKKIEGLKFW